MIEFYLFIYLRKKHPHLTINYIIIIINKKITVNGRIKLHNNKDFHKKKQIKEIKLVT